VNLSRRLLLVFATTFLGTMAVLYFLSRSLLLSHFRQLEIDQTKQEVEDAAAALYASYRPLGATTNDRAYSDRTYQFMLGPTTDVISPEFQNASMEELGIDLVLIRDLKGKTVSAKALGGQPLQEIPPPFEFLEKMFQKPQLQPSAVSSMPLDGLVDSPDGPYFISVRPILTSARAGEARGIFLMARRFDQERVADLIDLVHSQVNFERIGHDALSPDCQLALQSLQRIPDEIFVQSLSGTRIAGYTLIPDVFGQPYLVLRVDTPRPIYLRGMHIQHYLFVATLSGAILFSMVILFFLQRYVVSRVTALAREVQSIGERKAISERVEVHGDDELSGLARSINGMLQELENTQGQFLFIAENIHQIFWIKDAKTGAYEYISRAFEKVSGRPRASLAADPDSWHALLHPLDREFATLMKRGYARGKPVEFYFRIISEDGSLHWLWQRAFPSYGPDHQLKQIIGLTEDITDFKRNEEALLQAHQELEDRVAQRTAELAERSELIKLLVDSTPGAIYGVDADGVCTFCNAECLRLLGYQDATGLLGRKIHGVIHHSRPDGTPYPQAECPVFVSFRDGVDAHVTDEVFWKKDGTSFPVEYGSRQIRRDGTVAGAVVSFIDITARKRKEMELRHGQKLEAVGRLAAGIAHEINTPIQFVGDNTRFLQNAFQDQLKLIHIFQKLKQAAESGHIEPELLSEVARVQQETDWDYLEHEIPCAMEQMLDGVGRVATIVRGMKEFSHVDRTNEKAPGDLNRALESTLIVARNELKYVADVETAFGELPPVVCHLGDLNQVFLNLLVNAAHAIEDAVKDTGGKGTITVTTRRDGDWVEVSIADSGTGIPQEARDKIFDPFFTTKAVGRGTGQGLALARAIVVDKHGGTITFETHIGQGTTFFIRLPLTGSTMREEALVT